MRRDPVSPSVAFTDISRLVRPNRVAVVGASDRPGSLGYSTYYNVRNNSLIPAGAVPVNPRYQAVLGDHCYPRVSDVPGEPIDVAVVLATAEAVLDVVEDCAASGVPLPGRAELGFLRDRRGWPAPPAGNGAARPRVGPADLRTELARPGQHCRPGAAEYVAGGGSGRDERAGRAGDASGGIGRALMQWMDRGLGSRSVVLTRQRSRPGHRRLRQPYGGRRADPGYRRRRGGIQRGPEIPGGGAACPRGRQADRDLEDRPLGVRAEDGGVAHGIDRRERCGGLCGLRPVRRGARRRRRRAGRDPAAVLQGPRGGRPRHHADLCVLVLRGYGVAGRGPGGQRRARSWRPSSW